MFRSIGAPSPCNMLPTVSRSDLHSSRGHGQWTWISTCCYVVIVSPFSWHNVSLLSYLMALGIPDHGRALRRTENRSTRNAGLQMETCCEEPTPKDG